MIGFYLAAPRCSQASYATCSQYAQDTFILSGYFGENDGFWTKYFCRYKQVHKFTH